MNYSTTLLLALATLPDQSQHSADEEDTSPSQPAELAPADEGDALPSLLAELAPADAGDALPSLLAELAPALRLLLECTVTFRTQTITPATSHLFETQQQDLLRELGRLNTQWAHNHIEPDEVQEMPKHLEFQNNLYTRLNKKTPQDAWTLFGPIKLWRASYRPTDKNGEPLIFPLPMALGLVQGASPALAKRACQWLGEAGMSQERTLQRLRDEHNVGWGVPKLREIGAAVASDTTSHRHEVQVEKLLTWLLEADASQGRHKPLLVVGRDGVTLSVRCKTKAQFEVASTATVSVLDRRGKRVGTIYLAHVPESCQKTMSAELTKLLEEVLRRWEGTLPRLGYVTDSGDNETGYYEKTLKGMAHPRTGEQLEWTWVADYYHASQRVWTMAECLFGKCQSGTSWAKKMLKWLLTPGGVNRVLHSAAAFRDQMKLRGKVLGEFEKAYGYLRDRIDHMRYAEYRRVGLPCGSGVTEAACKTVYTQRLKLSGMHWEKPGAQVILDLRVLLLSDVWEEAYQSVLEAREKSQLWGQSHSAQHTAKKAS